MDLILEKLMESSDSDDENQISPMMALFHTSLLLARNHELPWLSSHEWFYGSCASPLAADRWPLGRLFVQMLPEESMSDCQMFHAGGFRSIVSISPLD
jgi:hypothetical protein